MYIHNLDYFQQLSPPAIHRSKTLRLFTLKFPKLSYILYLRSGLV